jgi:hypothetical protein
MVECLPETKRLLGICLDTLDAALLSMIDHATELEGSYYYLRDEVEAAVGMSRSIPLSVTQRLRRALEAR